MSVPTLNLLAKRIFEDTGAKGWHTEKPEVPTHLANIHSEVSEAWEDFRNRRMKTTIREDGKPEGFGSELADVLIRLLHTCETFGIDIEQEVDLKMAYNRTRPWRHGGKVC